MTLEEKVAQLQNESPELPRLGVPAFRWWTEALHGVARAGRATVFPQAIGLAATWNTELMQQVATAISDELRAKYHQHLRHPWLTPCVGLTVWSPNVNIYRDPRWGRGQETYGEDPHLSGQMAVAFVRGIQGNDARYLKAIATPKHFAVHSGPEAERHHFATTVSARDLHETYLPAFEAAVTDGGALSVMAAYNVVNGEACVASPTLLDGVLRRSWGFRGYVVSDCDAVMDVLAGHRLARSAADAAAMAIHAGCDLNCGSTYSALTEAVRSGLAAEADIDRSLERLLTARFRLGQFDPPEMVPWSSIPASANDSAAHRALARRAAQESLVLLRNDGVLPVPPSVREIAVIGPTADSVPVLLGNYHGTPSSLVTLLQGLRREAPKGIRVRYRSGSELTTGTASQRAGALDLARRADVIVLTLGLTPQMEGEEGDPVLEWGDGDRRTLELPEAQRQLASAIAELQKPTIMVLTGGGAIVPPSLPARAALLMAWYPGEEGGAAVADVVFGRAVPSGRLPITFYRSVHELPPFDDYAMKGRTYRYMSTAPLFAFGTGRSTTSFGHRKLQIWPATLRPGEEARVTLDVINTGTRTGAQVVQVYVRRADVADAPTRSLVGFQKVELSPGESKRLSFALGERELAAVDEQGRRSVRPGRVFVEIGGGQPDNATNGYVGESGLVGILDVIGREPVQEAGVTR